MSMPGYFAWNESLQRSIPTVIPVALKITGAKAVSNFLNLPIVTTFDAGMDTAAEITAALPAISTDEFVAATAFGSTAMGTDALAIVVDCGGQVREVKYVEVLVFGGSDANITSMNGVTGANPVLGISFQGQATALTNALTNQATASSVGNIGTHFAVTGLDALTAGMVVVRFHVTLK